MPERSDSPWAIMRSTRAVRNVGPRKTGNENGHTAQPPIFFSAYIVLSSFSTITDFCVPHRFLLFTFTQEQKKKKKEKITIV